MSLREVSHLHVRADPHAPAQRGHLAQDGADEGGLAAAVRPQKRHRLPAPHLELRDGEKRRSWVVPHDHVLEAEYQVPAASRLPQGELHRAVLLGLPNPLQSLQPLPAALRLPAPLTGDVATDERLGARDELLLLLIEKPLAGDPLGLLFQVVGVVAPVLLQFPPVQLPHLRGKRVEESAIVRHHHHRALPVREIALQPLHPGQVEVVRRLVQQEQVWLLQQESRQQGARLLTAAQLPNREVEVILLETEPGQHLLDARLVGVATTPLKGLQRLTVSLQHLVTHRRVGHGRLQALKLGRVAKQIGEDVQHRVPQGAPVVERLLGLLREVAYGDLLCPVDSAGGGMFLAADQAEQRGLPRAVGTDQGDPGLMGYGERDIGEDVLSTVRLGQIGSGDQGHIRYNPVPAPG